MADIYLTQIVDTGANIEAGAIDTNQIGLGSDTWSLYSNVAGDVYRYRPTEKNGTALAISFGAVSCASVNSSGSLSCTTLNTTAGITVGASSNFTGTVTSTVGMTTQTFTATTAMRTNTLTSYTGGVLNVTTDVTMDTGYDLTMSATGTIFTDTIDDVSGGPIAMNSGLKLAGSIVRDVLTDRFDLCGGTSISVAHGGSVRIEGNNYGGTGLGGDVMLYSGNTTNGAVYILTGPSSASAMQFLADQTCKVDGKLRITNASTPASASDTGTTGTIAWDTSYIYVCTATNTWKRVAIATW